MSCSVKCCKKYKNARQEGISFYQFPKNEDLLDKWLTVLNLKNEHGARNKSKLICSAHFSKDQFRVTEFTCKLKPQAVPQLLLNEGKVNGLDENMAKRWREEDTVKFVKLYKTAECLWNPRHPGYRNRNSRDEASNDIVRSMNIPDFGPLELKNKIKNIRSTYAQELNKIKRASIGMEGGENYRTSLAWFPIADSFLKPMFTENKSNNKAPSSQHRAIRAMTLALNDLFDNWEEWCATMAEYEEKTGHKYWKRRSRKVGAAKIRKELKPDLVYYEVQFECKVNHGFDCVDDCPPDCSQKCPSVIKLRASETGDALRLSKLVIGGVHKDTFCYNDTDEDNNHKAFVNLGEDNFITLQSIMTTTTSGNNSPEIYYPPLSIDANEIKTEILTEDDDEERSADYSHQLKRRRTEDSNNCQESNDSSSDVKLLDEFFYFGKNVECQLRQMSLDKALECQFKILEILAQYRNPT